MPSDWAADAAGRIEALVATVRANTVDRLAVLARLLVFGLVAAVMGVTALLLLVVGGVRALDLLLPRQVWLADVVLGAALLSVGLLLWSKARRPAKGTPHALRPPTAVPTPGSTIGGATGERPA